MSESPYSDQLLEWAAMTRAELCWRGGAWCLDHGEIEYFVRQDAGMWTLTRSERGQAEKFEMAAPDMADIERQLTLRFGGSIRSRRDFPMIWSSSKPSLANPEFRVVQAGDARLALVAADGSVRAVFRGTMDYAPDLPEFSWVADVPLDDLRASFLDPDGMPLFPELWIGPEGGQPPWMPRPGVEQTWVPAEGEVLLDESALSDGTVAWAGLAGFHLVAVDGGFALVTAKWEDRYFFREGSGAWTMTNGSKRGGEVFQASAPDLVDVERWLTVRLGRQVRSDQAVRQIREAIGADLARPGFSLPVLEPGKTGVVGPDGGLRALLGGGTDFPPAWFTWVVDIPLGELRASYLDPKGLPLFPGLWIGPQDRVPPPHLSH